MYTVLKLHSALWSNPETDVAPGENEFDTPGESIEAFVNYKIGSVWGFFNSEI